MESGNHLAFVALGSNQGDSVEIVRAVFQELEKLSISPIKTSSLWRSSPVDCPPGSPDFINAVAAIYPPASETPASLLAKLQHLEKGFGRRPKILLNEARPLDLDLLTFGELEIQTSTLILPHPRAYVRAFVLHPWNEIAPHFTLPGLHQTVGGLLAKLQTSEIIIPLD